MASDPRPPAPPLDDLRAALDDCPPDEQAALERLWLDLGEIAPVGEAAPDAAWNALRGRLDAPPARRAPDRPAAHAPARSGRTRRAWTVAALAAVAGLVAGLAWRAVPVSHTATPGATLAVALPDGSSVVLNSGATLRHARRFGDTRAVALHGEAFFDVEPGAVPFVVETHTARVEVLGTAFNVRAHADEAETTVALVHGRVRVAAVAGGRAAELTPGQLVVVAETVAVPVAADVERATSWRRGALVFEDRPLGGVLAEIERRYGVAVEAAAGTPLDARVSAFYAERPALDALLGDIGTAAGVRFTPGATGYTVRPAPRPAPAPSRSTS